MCSVSVQISLTSSFWNQYLCLSIAPASLAWLNKCILPTIRSEYAVIIHVHIALAIHHTFMLCKTNTVNDKSANFLAIYYKVLKHERSLSVTEPAWVCLPFLTAFVPVNLPTLTTEVLHFICSLFYPISSRYLTIFVHFYVGFRLFIVLL